jgi:hypothetical protein
VRVIEQDGKGNAEFFGEIRSLAGIVLGDADNADAFVSVGLLEPLEEWKCVLAGGARDFEEGQYQRAVREFVAENEALAVHGSEFEIGGLNPRR